MIRGISIFDSNGEEKFSRHYAKSTLDRENMFRILFKMKNDFFNRIEHINIAKYKITVSSLENFTLFTLSDRCNVDEEIEGFVKGVIALINKYELEQIAADRKVARSFEDEVDKLVESVSVKITLIGSGGVGKTTIVKLLEESAIPIEYKPTMFADIKPLNIKIGPFAIALFAAAGQKAYRGTWDLVMQATDVVVVVTDSTEGNIDETRNEILPYAYSIAPYARYFAVANKQDLANALPASEVEARLGIPAYPSVAINPAYKDEILEIFSEILIKMP
ncbi:MAG: ADP-ribosylation factor-like protein [Candidatus Korarchaeota archaeon]